MTVSGLSCLLSLPVNIIGVDSLSEPAFNLATYQGGQYLLNIGSGLSGSKHFWLRAYKPIYTAETLKPLYIYILGTVVTHDYLSSFLKIVKKYKYSCTAI